MTSSDAFEEAEKVSTSVDKHASREIDEDLESNRNSGLLGHVNLDGQTVLSKKSDKYGFISRFGH